MKHYLLKICNSLLSHVGAKVIKIDTDDFDMVSAMHRITNHDLPISSVIDIGASNGKWSIEAIKIFPHASFLAIEPLQEREKELQNLKQRLSNFDFSLCVAGDADDKFVSLNVSDDLDGSTVNGTGNTHRQVPTKTLDSLIKTKGLKGPFLIKFDTHGFEMAILKGAAKTIESTNVIIMEMYNFKITDNAVYFWDMCTYLDKLGFRCYDISSPLLRKYDQAFWQVDLFFCRKSSDIFSYPEYE